MRLDGISLWAQHLTQYVWLPVKSACQRMDMHHILHAFDVCWRKWDRPEYRDALHTHTHTHAIHVGW